MNIESAVYLLTQMRDEIDSSMFDPDAKAIDTALRRLSALERVAAAADKVSDIVANDDPADFVQVGDNEFQAALSKWVKEAIVELDAALAALRESEGGG